MLEIPLILGGHSFIAQLGNEPPASEATQRALVEACLDNEIRWFDTTYQPERVALGKVLHELGRRSEATILAWNFFADFTPGEPVGEASYYAPGHIDAILEQLRTDYVDCLVVVPLDDPEKNQRQEELALGWKNKGYVGSLGLWIRDVAILDRYRNANPFRFAIRPFNVTTAADAGIFKACKAAGFETLATSPFFRGWELDRIVTAAAARSYGDEATLRSLLADLMLRYSLFQDGVDRVIIAMRKVEWIRHNLESVARGALTPSEHRRLRRLRLLGTEQDRWWRRLVQRR
jgi:aryl-alcohol dehydrogenase-like predicted oxidoreductase